jgi:uncharacterized RDD family membrane protein YckC
VGSWLQGPGSLREQREGETYPGERLGLPRDGRHSIAGFGPRLVAVLVDWVAALLVARIFVDPQEPAYGWVTLGIFAVAVWVGVGLTGASLGQFVRGLRVLRLDGRLPGPAWALLRTLLLVLLIPALVWDRDGRGLHDRASGTMVVRAR